MSVEEFEGVEAREGATEAEGAAGAETVGVAAETLAAKRYPVAPGVRLNVRSGPGTNYRIVRVLPYGASVPINCQMPGEWIRGPYGTSNIWDNIGNGEFVSDAYIYTGSDGYVAIRCN
ncbi:SH3 domain-containing protein [Streptomyces sp. MUM 178J]|uniref:SH3 domain-containing protein n=1 Tax=Streptomyces sp. MUM 178J TaxID=2791991 RepID=UPI001F035193|nr:SH3 domain-containing protein [Streptomyces sp. MUM 178J]WRQ82085.1 peptidase [Streptomyces sp. MUM 178J]